MTNEQLAPEGDTSYQSAREIFSNPADSEEEYQTSVHPVAAFEEALGVEQNRIDHLHGEIHQTLSLTPRQPEPKPDLPQSEGSSAGTSTKQHLGWARNIIAAASFALAGLGFAAPAQAAQPELEQPTVSASVGKEASKGKMPSERVEQAAKEYVSNLGMFKKLALVDAIKKSGNDIRTVLDRDLSGGSELLAGAPKLLQPILKIYIPALTEMQTADHGEYLRMKSNLLKMVRTVETTPLTQLQEKL